MPENYVTSASILLEHAEAHCVSLGMHLVTINSEEENEKVGELIQGLTDFIWIGLNDRALEGRMERSGGVPVTCEFWKDGEPNDITGEDCV